MDTNKIFIILLIILASISTFIFLTRPLWIEPDSTAFYNRACLGGADFNTPMLSKVIFDLLPCDMLSWKIFHLLIVLAGISSLYYFGRKHFNDEKFFFIAFLSYFLLGFLLQLEDDQIAFPLIIVLTARLLENQTWGKRIGYGIATLFLTLFVWSGSWIPMTMFLGFTILPIIPIILPIGAVSLYFIQTGLIGFNDPGKTLETTIGFGFITNNILLLLLFFVENKKQKIKDNWKLFQLFLGFNLLGYFYPKLEYFSIIPLLLISYNFFDDKMKQTLILGGMIALVMAPALILWNTTPNQHTLKVIGQAVELQKSGKPVYNNWGLGRWFYYLGGKPTQEGGYNGEQYPDLNEYYWLGEKRKQCETISKDNWIYLQKCSSSSFV